jgi:hypothetical protein
VPEATRPGNRFGAAAPDPSDYTFGRPAKPTVGAKVCPTPRETVPERELLTAMCRAERIIDVEDLVFAWLRAGLIDESRGEPRRLRPARPILQTTDRRLRGQWRPACRTATDRDLHEWIVPQPVEVDGILVAAGDRRHARHHHLEHRVPDAIRIAAIRHRVGKPPAHPELALRMPQQQQTAV